MSSREEDRKAERLFDKRTLERNLRKGLIKPKEVEKRMESLPDIQEKVAPPPPELHLTPVIHAAPAAPIPTYNIVSRKDSFLDDDDEPEMLADDEDDDEDLDDEDDEDDDEDEDEAAADDDLPVAG